MKEPRFDYASAKSLEKINEILEDCFAAGEISPCEKPKIEKRNGRYFLTLPM